MQAGVLESKELDFHRPNHPPKELFDGADEFFRPLKIWFVPGALQHHQASVLERLDPFMRGLQP
jgi:hypothetical protein